MPTVRPDRYAYLDHAASTPMRAEAIAAMEPFLAESYGNPTGAHRLARDGRRAIDEARDVVAELLGCAPGEVVFTGSGTEADNLAISGRLLAQAGDAACSAIEHHAVLHPVERAGGTTVAVDAHGLIDLDALAGAIGPGTSVVSVMLANNEVGTIQPLDAVVEIVRGKAPDAVVHTDAVQAFPWLDVATRAATADLVAISAHKFGGPKGVGALAVRSGCRIAPLILGGGQERELRSGTHNVAGIVGLATAARLAADERKAEIERVGALRDELASRLLAAIDHVVETGVIGGDRSHKVAGNLHLCIEGVDAEALLFLIEHGGVLASAGSSCASGAQEPSHVLTAMGVPRELAGGSLRLSLGRTTTSADVEQAVAVLPPAVERLRALDPRS